MENPIDFLVIGAQKCATTWLYECLNDHPEICLPENKREVEYIGGDLYKAKGIDWYFSLVGNAKPGQLKGDVSVEYMYNPESAGLVKQYLPNVKLIASLRNPAERAISAYYWYLRKGLLPADKNIVETFTAIKQSYLSGDYSAQGVDIILRGLYDTQLNNYLSNFDKNQLMVVLYDEISSQPEVVLQSIYSFLGINTDFTAPKIKQRPKQNSYHKWLLAFERLNPKSRVISGISNYINQLLSSNKKPEYSDLEIKACDILSELFITANKNTYDIITGLPKANQPNNPGKIIKW